MPVGRVLLVRHGAVDHAVRSAYTPVYEGGRFDFVPLSREGVRQVERMAADLPVTEPGRVIASPYTRTLQTAAILSTRWGFPLFVDMALHDWLPVRDGRIPMSGEVVAEKIREYEQWRRTGVASATRTWETDMEMRERLLAAVERHRRRDTLVLVTHEAVIRSATGVADVPLASRHVLNSDG